MKKLLIELFRPLDNFLFNYFVKIGVIKPIFGAIVGGLIASRSAKKSRQQADRHNQQAQANMERAFEQIRDPNEILREAYDSGMFSKEMIDKIIEGERDAMGPMTDLLKDYGKTMAYGEDGLQEISEQTTESILDRMKELGPEFRKAMEDPRITALVDEQLGNFKKIYSDTQTTSEEREAAAKDFDKGLNEALTQAGVSIDAIQKAEVDTARPFLEDIKGFDTSSLKNFDTSSISDFDLSALQNFDTSGTRDFDLSGLQDFDTSSLKNFDLSGLRDLSFDDLKTLGSEQSSAFLGDIRGMTDLQRAEAERLTEAAAGPLGFEAKRRADQAARAAGGAMGRARDASAIARAALGREDQVMARQDRAAAARNQAAQMAALGGKLGLSQESLAADLATQAARLGLSQQQALAQLGLGAEQAALGLDLSAQEAASRLGLSAQEAADRMNLSATEAASRLGLGAKESAARLGLGAQEAATRADLSALGLGAELGLSLDKLGLARQELASNQAMNLAKMQGLFGSQARAEALQAREEGRAQFGTALNAAQAASVDPSQIFFKEAMPAFNLYGSILGQKPGTIFTDPGQAINVGSAYDVQRGNILAGQAAIAANAASGAARSQGSSMGALGSILGNLDFNQMRNPTGQQTGQQTAVPASPGGGGFGGFTGNPNTSIFGGGLTGDPTTNIFGFSFGG